MGGLFGGGGGVSMPAVEAQQPSRTAAPIEQISEQAKKNRRLAASLLTRDWGKAKLGTSSLLGIG